LLKLYRCPDCGCVIRLRPKGYFKRLQAQVETIRSSITLKSTRNRWLSGISRNRQGHWFRALKKRIKAYLTETWVKGVVAGFDKACNAGTDRAPAYRADERAKPGDPGHRTEQLDSLSVFASAGCLVLLRYKVFVEHKSRHVSSNLNIKLCRQCYRLFTPIFLNEIHELMSLKRF